MSLWTIRRDADPSEYLEVRVTNKRGLDISEADFFIGLGERHGSYPAMNAAVIREVVKANVVIIGMLITNAVPEDEYDLWVRIDTDEEGVPRRAGQVNVVEP